MHSLFCYLKNTIYYIFKYTLTDEVYKCIIIIEIEQGGRNTSIASDLIRGHTDLIILAQLIKKDSYGYEINKVIQQKSKGLYELKEATLYTAFRRLEQAECISSYWGEENVGARRRYYTITECGIETHRRLKKEWDTAKNLIDLLIEEEG